MTRKQLLSHSHIADTSNFGTGEYGEAHTKAAKKKFPAKSQLKQSAEQWGSYFMLHFFSASYIRHSYITLLSRKLFFLSPVCSVQCPSVPQAGLVRSTFSLPRMNCEMYWLLKHAFLSQLGSPGYKIVAQAVNLL